MDDPRPSFPARIWPAFVAGLRTLFDGDFAAGVARLRRGAALPADASASAGGETGAPSGPSKSVAPRPAPRPVVLRAAAPDASCQLLGIFQREGRLVDFLEEDVSAFSDAEIGAAARVVHEGCHKALHAHFELAPVRDEAEGSRITLEAGFDPSEVRLTGHVVGEAPFSGELAHRGWRVTRVTLPQLTEAHDARILTPAEVEL